MCWGHCIDFFFYRTQLLDCYTDPHGWKAQLNIEEISHEASSLSNTYKDVKNIDKLYSSIIELGKGNILVFLFLGVNFT